MDSPFRAPQATPEAAGGDRSWPETPVESYGHWCWEGGFGAVRFAFYGKATTGDERSLLESLDRSRLELASLRQVHSARVLDAKAGDCGEGDALVTTRAGLALRVVTADCVPVLLASPVAVAAAHAGWRGLAAGVLEAAVRRLPPDRPIRALVGPAIGACCYEVGPEVARAVAERAGSDSVILSRGEGRRPHLDLRLSALHVLRRVGVAEVLTIDDCTRCRGDRLWSYRRDGKGAGRNQALVWRER